MKKLNKELYNDMATPRYNRACNFASTILSLLQDFLPRDKYCLEKIDERLLRLAYEHNIQIINVPPEWDELNKLQMEKALLEKLIQPLTIKTNKRMIDEGN